MPFSRSPPRDILMYYLLSRSRHIFRQGRHQFLSSLRVAPAAAPWLDPSVEALKKKTTAILCLVQPARCTADSHASEVPLKAVCSRLHLEWIQEFRWALGTHQFALSRDGLGKQHPPWLQTSNFSHHTQHSETRAGLLDLGAHFTWEALPSKLHKLYITSCYASGRKVWGVTSSKA